MLECVLRGGGEQPVLYYQRRRKVAGGLDMRGSTGPCAISRRYRGLSYTARDVCRTERSHNGHSGVIKGEATFSVTRPGTRRPLGVQLMETRRACPRAALDANTHTSTPQHECRVRR